MVERVDQSDLIAAMRGNKKFTYTICSITPGVISSRLDYGITLI
ncbi:MAG: hypothetical protein CM15mP73_1300 [Hyphomicrobiales bacterium]|nr:MAG: hypothetical protein CM15mP73_1300 [Hyphomicrobiales bacterium]